MCIHINIYIYIYIYIDEKLVGVDQWHSRAELLVSGERYFDPFEAALQMAPLHRVWG